jgi:hypothetical protein
MKEEETAKKTNPSKRLHALRPRSLDYYLRSTKSRKKIGNVATKGYFQLREFLNKEIPLPSPGEITESFAGLLSRPFVNSTQNEDSKDIDKIEADNDKKEQDFNEAVKQSNEVLAEARTVFPFTLFPDTITLDRKKLVVTQRTFFMTSKVLTIQIEEILNIAVNVGPLFGSLHIAIRGLTSEDHFDVSFLWRKDAIHLKHMIEGYIIAQKEKLDFEHLSKNELSRKLAQLGSDSNPERY